MSTHSRTVVVMRSLGFTFLLLVAGAGCRPDPSDRSPTDHPRHRHGTQEPPVPSHRRPHEHGDAHPGHRHHGGHHRFEDAERWAQQFDDPSRDEWQRPDAVVGWIGIQPNDAVADLGAGTGYFTVRLARAAQEGVVFANDIEPDMVRYLGDRARREGLTNVVPVLGRKDDPGLGQTIDVAFMCDVFHHVERPELFFAALAKQMRPKGRLIVVDFDPDASEQAPGPPRAMRIAADEVVATLEPLGFRLQRRDDRMLPYQYVLEFVRSGSA